MTIEMVTGIGRGALEMALLLAAPIVLAGLVAGLVVSLLQAMTQVNEITLTFIPKVVASLVALVLFGPWMLTRLVSYTTVLFQSLPASVR